MTIEAEGRRWVSFNLREGRVAETATTQIRSLDYIEAARATGAGTRPGPQIADVKGNSRQAHASKRI
jgi:hypothetical protein